MKVEEVLQNDALREILLKLRKGSAAFLNAKRTEAVIALLDGWTMESGKFYRRTSEEGQAAKHLGFASRRGGGMTKVSIWSGKFRKMPTSLAADAYVFADTDYDQLRKERESSDSFNLSDWERHVSGVTETRKMFENYYNHIKAMEVDSLPDPSAKKAPAFVIMNVTDQVNDDTKHQSKFGFDMYVMVKGHKITSPDGQEYIVTPNSDLGYDGDKTTFQDWFTWASENTNILELVNEILGMKAHVKASERPRQAVGNQIIGTCAICAHEQVVRNGLMVLHGYQRPGIGYIQGECFGVGYDPYEVSTKAIEAYIPVLQDLKAGRQKRIADINSGKVTVFYRTLRAKNAYTKPEMEKIEVGHRDFDSVMNATLVNLDSEVRAITDDIAMYQKRMAAWKPGTLRSSAPF